tara:strand:- start:66 stop:245 length:180 start_codon:yes stop_codon:yes gene_type:complete
MKDKYIAIIESHDYKERLCVIVPECQTIEFDEGSATRQWLWPHLGDNYHLSEFVKLKVT